MTPQEKAKELFCKFMPDLVNEMGVNDSTFEININFSLIVVDEIFEAIDWHGYETPNAELLFWACVKKELLKMKS
jgi:hypothetical protein